MTPTDLAEALATAQDWIRAGGPDGDAMVMARAVVAMATVESVVEQRTAEAVAVWLLGRGVNDWHDPSNEGRERIAAAIRAGAWRKP